MNRLRAIGVCLALCFGCGKFTKRNAIERPRDEFVVAMGINPFTLDPAVSQDLATNDLLSHVYEGLVGHGADNRIEPRLAERWEVSPDGRTYTFYLRDAKFHNGKPVEAMDFKWTWERNCDPKMQSVTGGLYLGDIAGARDRLAGSAHVISGIEAVDVRTLRVTLEQPRATFLGKLTYPVASVMPMSAVPVGSNVTSIAQVIGAGPFRMTSYTPESQVELKAFEDYHGGPPTVKRLRMPIVKDASTRVNLLKTGKLDWAGLPHADLAAFESDPDFVIQQAERPAIVYIGMNGKVYPPFRDRRVRLAFNQAIDRERLVRDVLGGVGRVAEGILPPAVPQPSRRKPFTPFDANGAKKLLQDSGWAGKLPPLELWVSDPIGDRKRIAELSVSMLRETLGVDATLKVVELGVLIQKATKKEVGLFMGSWYMDYLDPENLLSVLLSSYGQNRTAYDRAEFTALCRKADAMPAGPDRDELYARAEDMALEDAVWIPLYHPREAIAVRKGITGLTSNAFGLMPPTKVVR